MLCALLVMQIGNNEILKELIARTRPFNLKEWQEIFVFPEMIARPSSWSFPSGHTSSGFAAVTALAITTKKARFEGKSRRCLCGDHCIYTNLCTRTLLYGYSRRNCGWTDIRSSGLFAWKRGLSRDCEEVGEENGKKESVRNKRGRRLTEYSRGACPVWITCLD